LPLALGLSVSHLRHELGDLCGSRLGCAHLSRLLERAADADASIPKLRQLVKRRLHDRAQTWTSS